MYEYRVKVLKVIDGDTVDVDIDLGFNTWIKNERVRLMGIDTPESRTSNDIEKKFGLAAKERLIELLGETAILKTQVSKDGMDMKGKFGRILGDFKTEDGRICANILCEEGHAVAYFGGAKEDIQKQHMKNRKKLVKEGLVEGPIQ